MKDLQDLKKSTIHDVNPISKTRGTGKGQEGRYKITWKRKFKLEYVDSDQ